MSHIDSDDGNNINNNEEDSADSDVTLPRLKTIWECAHINKTVMAGADGVPVSGWTCNWCPHGGRFFKGDNATKALAHVAKITGKNIQFCRGNIPRNKVIQYRNLWLEKSSAKADRTARTVVLEDSISDMQSRALESMFGGDSEEGGSRKRPHGDLVAIPSGRGTTAATSNTQKMMARTVGRQMKLCGNSIDPNAPELMNMAIADFIHSNCLPFSLSEDPKFLKVIQVAKMLGAYKPLNRQLIGGKYLDVLYDINRSEQMKTLLSESSTFGITLFGDGATIKTVPLLNILAAGVNNSFALLTIDDCTEHLATGGMKDAPYIASVIKPLILELEQETDDHNRKCTDIVDLVFFDGASNVQNAGQLLRVKYPRITVGHGAEHVVSLFFKDVYEKVCNPCNVISFVHCQ
jgi:hypothetical protein